jgi:hypothetical protein
VRAALGQLRSLLFPDHGASAGFAAIPHAGFELRSEGIDPPGGDLLGELAHGHGPVSLGEVLDDADLATTDAGERVGDLGGRRSGGYAFAEQDQRTEAWFPQGLTGSADASADGLVGGRRVQLASWYSKQREGVRISFVDLDAHPVPRYRHVLLVKPAGGHRFERVRVHAGGIAWVGSRLFVADTNRGLRVFDTCAILRAADPRAAGGHAYLLPQVGAYRASGLAEGLAFSYAFLDRPDRALVIGEYRRERGGRILRWPIDLDTGKLAPGASAAHAAPVDRVQGIATFRGHVVASCSRPGGRAFAGRPGEPARGLGFWPRLPEDLHVAGDTLFSLSERPGRRAVFGVPLAAFGL